MKRSMNSRDLHCQDQLPLPVGSLQELAFIAYINTNKFDINLCKSIVKSSSKLPQVELLCENRGWKQRYVLYSYQSILHILDYVERERRFKCTPHIFCTRCVD